MQLAELLKFINDEEILFHENIGKSMYRKRSTPPPPMTARLLRDLGFFNVSVDTQEEGRALWEYYCSFLPDLKRPKEADIGLVQLMLFRGQPVYEKYSTEKEKEEITDLYFLYLQEWEKSKYEKLITKLCSEHTQMFLYKIEKRIYHKYGRVNPDMRMEDMDWIAEELRFIGAMTKGATIFEGSPGKAGIVLPALIEGHEFSCAKVNKAVADLYNYAGAANRQMWEQALVLYDTAVEGYTACLGGRTRNPRVSGLINDCKEAKRRLEIKLADRK